VTAGLLLGAPVLALGYIWRVRHLASVLRGRASDPRVGFYLIWLAPMVVFWVLVYTQIPGHVLSYFYGLIVLTAAAVVVFAEKVAARWRAVSSTAVALGFTVILAATNVSVFFLRPSFLDVLHPGAPLTYRDIRTQDERLRNDFNLIRAHFPPDRVLVCHAFFYLGWSFRQFQYYLPEYHNAILTSAKSLPGENGRKLWIGYQRQTLLVPDLRTELGLRKVLVVPPDQKVTIFQNHFDITQAKEVPGSEGRLYELP
jgi:hypothetical protein